MARNTYKNKDSKESKGKFRRSRRNSNKPSVEREGSLDSRGRDNDPNWYFTNADLANQASQLSFQSILGYSTIYEADIPTIARIDTVMNPGCTYNVPYGVTDDLVWYSEEMVDVVATHLRSPEPGKAGVNLMAAKLYTTLSSFTGRTASYAPQDVAMMILAISSIAEISETIRRVFGIALTYNFRNRTLPLGMIRSMGIDAQDLVDNLSIYRMRFNVALSRINQIPLLENIAFIRKSRDVYQNIYMDGTSSMSQLYYYFPHYYFVLDEEGDSNGSILRAKDFSANQDRQYITAVKMSVLLSHLEEQITAVLESSTLNFIYADLLNMANKVGVKTWKFDYLAENYVVMPIYNANANLQFHNLTIMGEPCKLINEAVRWTVHNSDDIEFEITAGANVVCDTDKNNILYNPVFHYSNVAYGLRKWILDVPTDNPTVEDRIEALRYTSLISGFGINPDCFQGGVDPIDQHTGYVFNALADHYVAKMYVFGNIDFSYPSDYHNSVLTTNAVANTYTDIPAYVGEGVFEHFPLLAMTNGIGSENTLALAIGDLEFFTEYDYTYLKRINDIMTVGLFDFRV